MHQLLRARGSKANKINNCIGAERGDARAECAGSILRGPVDLDAFYCVPCRMRYIRRARSTAGDDYLVTRVNQSRDEECADMTGSSNDDNSH